jgi:hypothetical protein
MGEVGLKVIHPPAALLLGLALLSGPCAAADDTQTECTDLISGLRIKAGSDYDAIAGKLRAKGWHQTLSTTQNIGVWTKGGHAISVTLNLGSGTSPTTTGAVRCRH